MTPQRFLPAILVLAGLSQAAFACDRLPPDNADQDPVRAVNLSAAWTDATILQNLKLQIARAEVKQTASSDSSTTEYGYFQRTVTITRSAKNGVQVKLVEKDRPTLNWKLGSCERTVPGRPG